MVNLNVIVLLLGCYTFARAGEVCIIRFVGEMWETFGDCNEVDFYQDRMKSKIAADQMRGRVNKENGVTQETTSPGPGWRKSGNRFYKCFNDEKATYQDAKDVCSSYGGRLAAEVLRDPVAASYIASNCIQKFLYMMRPWVGFDEIVREGDWIWSDGGAMNPVTTKWLDGEPNNDKGADEDCGNIRYGSNNKLLINDAPCQTNLAYICEV